jgi:hypothetical protein
MSKKSPAAVTAKTRAHKKIRTTRQHFRQSALEDGYHLLVMGMDPALVIELLEVLLGQVDGLASSPTMAGRVEMLDQMEALRDRAYSAACSTNPHIVKLVCSHPDQLKMKLRTVPQAIASVKRIATKVRALLPRSASKPMPPAPTSRTSTKKPRPNHLRLVPQNGSPRVTAPVSTPRAAS